ncbi:arginine methyl transferase [Cantharellus anzutake]|uniref:arginine methyl transferase n=1 Tax=Cantharellus anzutake TaxID=1750568 RepID=UPI001908FDAF|nr:arginine methyl transferase [Cantharellus anzutake]KAF8324473.1 arginine methyl transferase [Cantharellus anzutake]
MDDREISQIIEMGSHLFAAVERQDQEAVRYLLTVENAPTWYQEPESGWTALHLAASLENSELISILLDNSALWNAVDACGYNAGDVALSLNNEKFPNAPSDIQADPRCRHSDRIPPATLGSKSRGPSESQLILKSSEDSSAGSPSKFLASRLRFTKDNNGQEICLASLNGSEEVGVMMGWESVLETVKELYRGLETDGSIHVLNIGFGLGIIDTIFQTYNSSPPTKHFIIEPHPDVLAHMRENGWYEKPGVKILEGKWQDFTESEELYAVGGFDIIYTDTFSEDYSDLLEFFEHATGLLRDQNSRFSFFNGLGATNATFYDVYTNLAEMHLSEIGLLTRWTDVDLTDSNENGETDVWGKTRVYFNLPIYRMPICQMMQ